MRTARGQSRRSLVSETVCRWRLTAASERDSWWNALVSPGPEADRYPTHVAQTTLRFSRSGTPSIPSRLTDVCCRSHRRRWSTRNRERCPSVRPSLTTFQCSSGFQCKFPKWFSGWYFTNVLMFGSKGQGQGHLLQPFTLRGWPHVEPAVHLFHLQMQPSTANTLLELIFLVLTKWSLSTHLDSQNSRKIV